MRNSGAQERQHDQQSRPGADRGQSNRLRADGQSGLSRSRPGKLALAGSGSGSGARNPGAAGALDGFVGVLADAVAERLEGSLAALLDEAAGRRQAPALLDRRGLADALGCGCDTIDRLRREGCPELTVGDAPRFELGKVLEWLRTRRGGADGSEGAGPLKTGGTP